jgi:hypothetical protein
MIDRYPDESLIDGVCGHRGPAQGRCLSLADTAQALCRLGIDRRPADPKDILRVERRAMDRVRTRLMADPALTKILGRLQA